MTAIKPKKRNFLHKILVFIAFISIFLLILGYGLPFIQPKTLKGFASLSLITPFVILLNILLMFYWLFTLQRYFWIHFVILALGYPYLIRFYKLDGEKIIKTDDVKIMNYNVRMFNKYHWSDVSDIPEKISDFINDKAPDIICFQDFAKEERLTLDYPYKYEKFQSENSQFGQAIYSKFPIIDKGSLDFKHTANNIIYADIKILNDTVRVYNVHLQSIKLNPKKEYFGEKDAEQLQIRISKVFQIQQEQVEEFLAHQAATKHPIIISGDFNNTAFSWVYRKMKKGKNDAYVKAGVGFDPTYDLNFPLRIDFLLIDEKIKINYFKTYKEKYSDHFPILTRLDKESFE